MTNREQQLRHFIKERGFDILDFKRTKKRHFRVVVCRGQDQYLAHFSGTPGDSRGDLNALSITQLKPTTFCDGSNVNIVDGTMG